MSVISSVTLNSSSIEILPGSLTYSAEPVLGGRRENEPLVVKGFNYVAEFDADYDNTSSIDDDSQGSGSNTLTITGFPTIYNAIVSIVTKGTGIQTSHITVSGTKSST